VVPVSINVHAHLTVRQATIHAVLNRKKSNNPWVGVFLGKPDQVRGCAPLRRAVPPGVSILVFPLPAAWLNLVYETPLPTASVWPWVGAGHSRAQVENPKFSLTSVNQLHRTGTFAQIQSVAPVSEGVQVHGAC
jgi:hypothetical protein